MTYEIALTFGILFIAIILFVTEVLRADLVALLVLVILVIVQLITPLEAISGFANPAVVTIWAVFILSAGLARTGVATFIGNQVLRLAGNNEKRLLSILMTSTAILSGFMNNIGVAAMFLPVTMDIARRTKQAASRLLMPMAYGTLLGGMLVLIGTASNLVVNDFLRESGVSSLGLFDFTPLGMVILLVTVLYMNLIGRRMLPERKSPQPLTAANGTDSEDHRRLYGLEERLAWLIIPENSPLTGKTLSESRFSRALGLNVLSVERKSKGRLTPDTQLVLEGGDRLLVLGRLDQFEQIFHRPLFVVETDIPPVARLLSEYIGLAEFIIQPDSPFAGKTLTQLDFRKKHHINVLAVRSENLVRRTNLQTMALKPGDYLLIEGPIGELAVFSDQPGFRSLGVEEAKEYHLDERLLFIDIPEGSALAGKTLAEIRLGAAYGITVLNIIRAGQEWQLPDPEMKLEVNDQLIISGHPTDIEVLNGLQNLEIQRDVHVKMDELETGPLAIIEVMLSPYTSLAGKTLHELHFREKYGVSVLAIWRGDRSYRTGLSDFKLQYGDAFLCYGPRERFEILARERDFFVLRLDVQEKPRLVKAPLAALIMLSVVAVVILNWLPIYVAAIAGATLMVLTRCLSMDEAHRSIDWKAVFIIAAMLPMGLAIKETGAAQFLATQVVNTAGPFGNTAILGGLVALTLMINPFIPGAVNAVVMSPIALATAFSLGVSPYPFIMGVAYACASSFMTPVSHPANLLVMSPGGYRFSDYLKNGLPIAIIVLVLSTLLLPILFPF
jgi:di/tricarboxylate transporter